MAHAISCSPCLIVLRHAEALSHMANTVDGKEGSFASSFTSYYCELIVYISVPLIFQTLQQCVDDANTSQSQQSILLAIVEQGKMPESISFSNEMEIKVVVG